jgi:hypothetical protein
MTRSPAPPKVFGLALSPATNARGSVLIGTIAGLEISVWYHDADGWLWDMSLVGRGYHRTIAMRLGRRGLSTSAAACREVESRVRLIHKATFGLLAPSFALSSLKPPRKALKVAVKRGARRTR